MSMGIPWQDQELSIPLSEFLVKFRASVICKLTANLSFSIKETDHNAGSAYDGLSNKQITIAAVMLDPSCANLDYPEKVRVVMKAAFGQ